MDRSPAGRLSLAVVTAAALLVPGCPRTRSPVARYLDGAEFQYETGAQRENLTRAFEDILNLPEDSLRARRYADYQGNPGQWDLPTLFSRHLVPDSASKTLGAGFYGDVRTGEARRFVEQLHARLTSDSNR